MSSSTITYTSVYTNSEPGRVYWGSDEELPNGGSPRVIVYEYDGLLMQPIVLPSPDYVPGPEHPPSPDYVPGTEHPPPPDQPLHANALPTVASLGYVVDSDPDEDPEEDPEEDHANDHVDGGDSNDEPSDDDDDDDDTDDEDEDEEPFEDKDDDDEEEEHLAPTDSSAIPVVDIVPSAGDTEEFETDESAPTPRSPQTMILFSQTRLCRARKTLRLEPPMAARIRMRALLPPTSPRNVVPEAEMPPRKRACFTTPALGLKIGKSSAAGAARQPEPTLETDLRCDKVKGMGYGIKDTWDEIVEAMLEVAPTIFEGVDQRVTKLDTTIRQMTEEFEKMAPRKSTARTSPATTTTTTTPVTDAQLRTLIAQGVAAALAERNADMSRNVDDNNDSGTDGRRQVSTFHECTYTDLLKCQPMNFKGTKRVISLTQWLEKIESVIQISNCTVACQVKFATFTLQGNVLTWWKSRVWAVVHDVAHAMPWKTLNKMMTDKYCPRSEIKKLETKMWNLKVKGTDVMSYNQRFQELVLISKADNLAAQRAQDFHVGCSKNKSELVVAVKVVSSMVVADGRDVEEELDNKVGSDIPTVSCLSSHHLLWRQPSVLKKEWRFAEDVSGDALATLGVNKLRGTSRTIISKAQNTRVKGEVVVDNVKESDWEFSYNAITDKYKNFVESEVIDQAKVTRCAFQNASSELVVVVKVVSSMVVADGRDVEEELDNKVGSDIPTVSCLSSHHLLLRQPSVLKKEWRFAEDVSGDALVTLVVNKLRGIHNVIVIKASMIGVEYQANDLGLFIENASVEQHNPQRLPHLNAQALQETKNLTISEYTRFWTKDFKDEEFLRTKY
nr:hypothetical protein [Tanacetum cinerariifolium]